MRVQKFVYLFIFFLLVATGVLASPNKTTYQARIVKPDGYPLEANNVAFRFTILDPTGTCTIYIESYSAVNMANSGGLISFSLGSGTRVYPASATTFASVFDNSTVSYSCQTPGIFTPISTDIRKVAMQFNDGSGWQTLPAMSINAVPYAMYAGKTENSLLLNGKADTNFVEYSAIPTCTGSNTLHFNGATFSCIVGGASYTVSAGDITTALGYTPANPGIVATSFTTVAATINNLGTSVTTVTSALSTLSASYSALAAQIPWITSGTTIYYTNGNVGIGTSSPSRRLEVHGSAAIAAFNSSSANHGYLELYTDMANPTSRTGYIGYPTSGSRVLNIYSQYTSGTVQLQNSLGFLRLDNQGRTGVNVSIPVTALDVSGGVRIGNESATCAPALAGTLRYSSSNIEYCNGTSWTAFGVAGAGVTGFNGSTSSTQTLAFGSTGTLPSVNTLDGVHTFNIPLAASAAVTAGLLSNADYLNFTNKVNATSAAVIAALGYTPAASGSFTSSQWNTSGTTINYTNGNVGIGTSNAIAPLDVSGTIRSAITSDGNFLTLQRTSQRIHFVQGIGQLLKFTSDSANTYDFQLDALNRNIYMATGGGNVGIGTANPGAKFAVSGSLLTHIDEANLIDADGSGAASRNRGLKTVGYDSTSDQVGAEYIMQSPSSGTGYLALGVRIAGTEKYAYLTSSYGSGPTPLYINATNSNVVIPSSNLGVGVTSATARLQISQGSTSVAPIKLTSGSLLTAPQSGTIEYDGFNYYITDGGNIRRTIATESTPGNLNNISVVSSTSNIALWPASGGSVIVSATTASTNSQTGALVVKGGLGVAGAANIAGALNVSGTIMTSSYFSAASLMYLYGTGAAYNNALDAYAGGERGFTADLGVNTAWNLLKLKNASGTQFIVDSGGYTGIGTTNPDRRLTIIGDGTNYGDDVMIEAANSDLPGTFAQINLAKSRGTSAARTAVQPGDTLGALAFRGQNASSLSYGAMIKAIAETDYSVTQSADLRFQTTANGTTADRMTINSSGNIGIGTAAPSDKLHIDAPTSGRMAISSGSVFSTSGYGLSLESDTDDGIGYLNLHTAALGANRAEFQIRGGHGGSELASTRAIMSLKTDTGRVGIGNTSPTAELHIGNQEATAGTSGSITRMAIQPYGHTGGPYLVTARDLGADAFLDFEYGPSDIMTFEDSGKIGMGTQAPTQKLHVSGSVQVDGDIYGGKYGGTRAIWRFSTADPNYGIFYTEASPDIISFSPQGGGSATPTMAIVGTLVGIGTSAPSSQLSNNATNRLDAAAIGLGTSALNWTSNSSGYVAGIENLDATTANRNGLVVKTAATDTGSYIAKFESGSSNKMTVRSDGNVGIGTGTPVSNLEVSSASQTYVRVTTTANNTAAEMAFTNSGATDWVIGADGPNRNMINNGAFHFWKSGYGTAMLLDDNGYVGIGTATPGFTLDVNGSIAAVGALQAHSDRRLKKNIVNVDSPLEKLQDINGVYFDWRKDEFPKIKFEGGRQLGVIAQEVEKVFPEAVAVNKDGIRSVAYTMLIAPLIEAVKELYSKFLGHDEQLASHARQIDTLKKENAELKARLEKIERTISSK